MDPLKGERDESETDDSKQCNALQSDESSDPIDYWRQSGYHWPQREWSKPSLDEMNPLPTRSKRLNNSTTEQSPITPSDQLSREGKNAPYRDPSYEIVLKTKNSFMQEAPDGIVEKSKELVRYLLSQEHDIPQGSLFRDEVFKAVCNSTRQANETMVIEYIARLIVPSAILLEINGMSELKCLAESMNAGWNNSIPLTEIRPQPDYGVGFGKEAFTVEQQAKLRPLVRNKSYYMATMYIYFPFLTCEVKSSQGTLEEADRQNAHSMTLAVRGVVELFRLVGREKELDREILAFSISHDHCMVRIYGHYAVIGDENKYYRHTIRKFDITDLDGRDKWTAYNFTLSVYKAWMPTHLKRLCSVIDALPADLNFDVSME